MRFGFALLPVLLAAAAAGQDVPYEKYTLPNGMKVILHEDHSLPVVAVNLWVHVGAKDEPPGRSGFAHLFEHLMFMGTERVPEGQFDVLMETGGGANNATTSQDRTNYYSSGPAELLPLLLWLEADRLEDLGRMMDQRKLDLQREVVRNERREGVDNRPYGKAYEGLWGLMFPPGHPYHTSVIGSHEELEAATVEDVKEFFATYYVPNNVSLVVAGSFDSAQVKPLIARLFGTLPRRDDPFHRTAAPVRLDGMRRQTMVDDVRQPKVIMAWHSPALYGPGDAEMDIAGGVLSDGVSSRLYRRLITERKIAGQVSASQWSLALGSMFLVDVTAEPETDLHLLEREIDAVLTEFVREGPTEGEVRREAAKIELATLSELQSIATKADRLNEYEFHFGEPNAFRRVLDAYRSATPASVRETAARTLDLDARLMLRVIPGTAASDQKPRDERPAPAGERPFRLQEPEVFQLANGVRVHYWHRPELPLMALGAQFAVGAVDDGAHAGRAQMTAEMLRQGTVNLTAEQFQDALHQLGARFSVGVGRESATANLFTIASNWEPALALYADALRRPRFDAADWERVQRVHLAWLQRRREQPGAVATDVAWRELFRDHAYGRPIHGTEATIPALNLPDLRAAHQRLFSPFAMSLFAAGSLPPDQVRRSLDKALGDWVGAAIATRATVDAPAAPTALTTFLVERPGAVQTVIRFAMPAPAYADPRRVERQALSTVLGGSFTSRLNANLREDKGYTYGAGSRYTFMTKGGMLTAVSEVRADVTRESLQEFLNEFAAIRRGDITPDEAEKARSTLRTDMVQSMGDLQSLLAQAMELHLHGRPFRALEEDLTRMGRLTEAEVNALAKEAVPLERGVLVLVGDREVVEKALAALNLPPPKIVTP
jgi:zinc protease